MEGKSKKNGMEVCPDDETFIDVFLGRAGLRAKEKIVDHALKCKSCALKFDMLVRLQDKINEYEFSECGRAEEAQYKEFWDAAKQKMGEIESGRRPFRFGFGSEFGGRFGLRLGHWVGSFPKKYLAAVGALVMVFMGYLAYTNWFHKEVYRDFGERSLVLLEPIGEIEGPPMYLKWKAIDQADGYDVRIIDEYLTTVAILDPNNNDSITIPEEIRARLKPGITYIWVVEAFNEEDIKIAEAQKHFIIH